MITWNILELDYDSNQSKLKVVCSVNAVNGIGVDRRVFIKNFENINEKPTNDQAIDLVKSELGNEAVIQAEQSVYDSATKHKNSKEKYHQDNSIPL